MKIDNLISKLICCMACIPSTIWWRRLKNWEIPSTIYETTGAVPAVPLKVRWWVSIYGTRIGGTTSFLYLMNMRAFAGYIWVICPKKEIIWQKPWIFLSGTRRFKGVDSSFLRRFFHAPLRNFCQSGPFCWRVDSASHALDEPHWSE